MLKITFGISQNHRSKEAVNEAAQQVLNSSPPGKIRYLFCLVSGRYDYDEIISGLNYSFHDTPVWGISSDHIFFNDELFKTGLLLIAFLSEDLVLRSHLFSYDQLENSQMLRQLVNQIKIDRKAKAVVFQGDAWTQHLNEFCGELAELEVQVLGGASSFHAGENTSIQFNNKKWVRSGMHVLIIETGLSISSSVGHGWQPVGLDFVINEAEKNLITKLGTTDPGTIYSEIFNRKTEDWQRLPYKNLLRLYPLGVEVFPGSKDLQLKSPLRIDESGALLLNSEVVEGQIAYLMAGNSKRILQAVEAVKRRAYAELDNLKPSFALLFLDVSYLYYMQSDLPDFLIQLKKKFPDIPVIGLFTLGQVFRASVEVHPQMLNQNILLSLFGSSE